MKKKSDCKECIFQGYEKCNIYLTSFNQTFFTKWKLLKETHQSDAGVNESSSGDDCEESDELVRILLELEVHRSREHDGPDQPALDGAKPGPKNDGQNAVAGIVASLKLNSFNNIFVFFFLIEEYKHSERYIEFIFAQILL